MRKTGLSITHGQDYGGVYGGVIQKRDRDDSK